MGEAICRKNYNKIISGVLVDKKYGNYLYTTRQQCTKNVVFDDCVFCGYYRIGLFH